MQQLSVIINKIIETSQMDCYCANQKIIKYNELVEDLIICLEKLPKTNNTYANIDQLKGHVNDYTMKYKIVKNNTEKIKELDNELAGSICCSNQIDQNLMNSILKCIETFRENL
ncbi:uncharacterized protein LOC126896842 isoform X2 [Daktulosphaira vitifoliae]|uniref:uncharacterized protein LOC126896842 isoform X2 n=1 Tax=Daktulosphaira vitifoliae TaxID=58002 RepID=UPI0021A9BF3A|nr:uncharacterized protein LOC126896842 isoform X2 [Daktulosphaira vitifoliae]